MGLITNVLAELEKQKKKSPLIKISNCKKRPPSPELLGKSDVTESRSTYSATSFSYPVNAPQWQKPIGPQLEREPGKLCFQASSSILQE